jgi:hypothetical protein
MATKFICCAKTKTMVLVNIDGKEEWAKTTDKVVAYAKEHFQRDEEVVLVSKRQGKMLFIDKIMKPGQTEQAPAQTAGASSAPGGAQAPVQEQKPPQTGGYQKNNSYGKSPEEQASIRSQAIGHMVSRTLIAMQGTVEPNNVCALIDTLYQKYSSIV